VRKIDLGWLRGCWELVERSMVDGKVEGQKVEADAEGLPHAPRHGAKQYRAGKVWPTNESPNQGPPQNFDIAKSRLEHRVVIQTQSYKRVISQPTPASL